MSSLIAGSLTPAERSKRSILVGNIQSEATEEQLRLLLLEFGPIVNFRFFNDSSGNQIGYAFCEYENQEMAVRAINKLNDFPFKGQALKIDTAASDKSKEELEIFLQGSGSIVQKREVFSELDGTTEKAPEEISKAVASLPPEQMFELMKQMKMCIENNPHEARNLLLQNPQLAYALLQAQVIMRIVDPEVAVKILDRPMVIPSGVTNIASSDIESPGIPSPDITSPILEPVLHVPSAANSSSLFPTGIPVSISQAANLLGNRTGIIGIPPIGIMPNVGNDKGDQDLRELFGDSNMRVSNGSELDKQLFDPRYRTGIDPRMMQGPNIRVQDPRMISVSDPRGMQGHDPRGIQGSDPRGMQGPDPRGIQGPDLRGMQGPDPRGMQGPDPRGIQGSDPRGMKGPDPRGMQSSDPRGMRGPDPRGIQGPDPRAMQGPDLRGIQGHDPRGMLGPDSRVLQVPDPRGLPGHDPRTLQGLDPRLVQGPDSQMLLSSDPRSAPSSDPRSLRGQDPRTVQISDPRMMPISVSDPRMMPGVDPRMIPGTNIKLSGIEVRLGPADTRTVSVTDPRMMSAADPRMLPGADPRVVPDPRSGSAIDPRARPGSDPRMKQVSDPRVMQGPEIGNVPPVIKVEDTRKPSTSDGGPASATRSSAGSGAPSVTTTATQGNQAPPNMASISLPQDQEKAALIMQVLQLSDEQIAMLPPEQRQSILILKEQIARSHLVP